MKRKTLTRPLEIKSIYDSGEFVGYGSVFGNEDSQGDVVMPGAFKQTLKEWGAKGDLPPVLWQHLASEPIGIYTKMREDDHGLLVEGRLLINDDLLARRAYSHLRAGSVKGLSVGYNVPKGGGQWDEDAGVYRLSEIQLFEVSLVTFPANDQATGAVKGGFADKRSLENYLRDAGFSKSEARALIAGGYDGLGRCEAADSGLSELNAQINGLAAKFKS